MTFWSTLSAPFRNRSYSAAGGGRRWDSTRHIISPVAAASAARGPVAARARAAAVNDPIAACAVMAYEAALVSTGIKPSSLHPDADVRATLNARFTAWTDESDADGLSDWYGQQGAMVRSMVITGESLAVLLNTDKGLRIRLIDPEQLDPAYTVNLDGGRKIVSGVEFDADGMRVAYHIYKERPGQGLGQFTLERQRIPAGDVVHMFRADWPGQVRGVSWLAPVLDRLGNLDSWRRAQIDRQRIAASLAGFLTSPDGAADVVDGTPVGTGTIEGGIEPGSIKVLPPGTTITFSTPAGIGQEVIEFAATLEKDIAVGLGLPVVAFGDLSKANFSSLKQGTLAFKNRIETIQHSVIVFQALLPVWRRWVSLEVLSGRIGGTTVEAALPVKHVSPQVPHIDAAKEIAAEVLEIDSGLKSLTAVLAARGEDFEQVMRERAAEQAMAKSLGLTIGTPQPPANNNVKPAAAAA